MQFAQILVTDDQALKTRLALDLILQDPERFVMTDEERADYERLAVFFGYVAENPAGFAPRGEMARTVKRIVRRAKGPAQPASRRKVRSQGQQKRDRKARREMVAAYNAAVEQYEKDARDAAEYHEELAAKFADEPRVQVMRADGQIIMSDIPASMVVPIPAEPEEYSDPLDQRTTEPIYVPGQRPDGE